MADNTNGHAVKDVPDWRPEPDPMSGQTRGRISSEKRKQDASNINLRKSHPNLYRAITVHGVMCITLGFSYLLTTPTFQPIPVPKWVIGLIFLLLGIGTLLFLNVIRRLRLLRLVMAMTISYILFWGLVNTRQVFAGKASFTLPIVYVTVAILEFPLLIEAPVNPFTERGRK